MAKVDFYVLPGSGEQARRQFACRLTEKAYRMEHRIRLLAADPQAAGDLDKLLWTWRDGSFVPHEIVTDGSPPQSPVTIGCALADGDSGDLLINLTDTLPPESAFPRIAEIVTSDDDQRRLSRQRYAQYREQGHELDTHKL